MKQETNITFTSSSISFFLLLMGMVFFCSCKGKTPLESYMGNGDEHWKHDLILPMTICTPDSSLMLIVTTYGSILNEVKGNKTENNSVSIYKAVTENIPIVVSPEYYKDNIDNRVVMDPEMYHIYQKHGTKGLIEKYFKKFWLGELVLYHSTKMFVTKSEKPLHEFGRETNKDYMAYLLFREGIYLYYGWYCEEAVGTISILESISKLPTK